MPQEINKRDIAPMVYKALTQAEEEIAKENGKVLGKTPIVGHDQAVEIVTAYDVPDWPGVLDPQAVLPRRQRTS